MGMRARSWFRPIRLFAVVQVHSVFDEARTVVEMEEGITGELVEHGRGGRDAVVMARPNQGVARQPLAQATQGMVHLFGITAAQIATPAAEHEQGIARQHLAAEPVTG